MRDLECHLSELQVGVEKRIVVAAQNPNPNVTQTAYIRMGDEEIEKYSPSTFPSIANYRYRTKIVDPPGESE